MNIILAASFTEYEEFKSFPSLDSFASLFPYMILLIMILFFTFFIFVSRPEKDKKIANRYARRRKIIALIFLAVVLLKMWLFS